MNPTESKIFKPKIVQKLEESEIYKTEVSKNVFLRVLIDENNEKMIDIRRYYKGFPTKQGIRFNFNVFNFIKEQLDKLN